MRATFFITGHAVPSDDGECAEEATQFTPPPVFNNVCGIKRQGTTNNRRRWFPPPPSHSTRRFSPTTRSLHRAVAKSCRCYGRVYSPARLVNVPPGVLGPRLSCPQATRSAQPSGGRMLIFETFPRPLRRLASLASSGLGWVRRRCGYCLPVGLPGCKATTLPSAYPLDGCQTGEVN